MHIFLRDGTIASKISTIGKSAVQTVNIEYDGYYRRPTLRHQPSPSNAYWISRYFSLYELKGAALHFTDINKDVTSRYRWSYKQTVEQFIFFLEINVDPEIQRKLIRFSGYR